MMSRQEKPLDFFIFGSPVTMSPSPDMHEVGFRENGFLHRYMRFDAPDVEEVLEKLRCSTCGGGSVTIPHKEAVLPHMDELSEAARVIGAVNTISKLEDGRLHGDNTDWLGIRNQLEARLADAGWGAQQRSSLTCIICGSGGTARAAAYALQRMGATRVLIHNRTWERAESLAQEFGFEACPDLATALASLEALDVVISTIPGSTGFELPDATAMSRLKPIIFEASYIPRQTALVKQALSCGCEVIEGLEMLFEQGCAQCEIWTGLSPPRSKIAAALVRALFSPGSKHPAHVKMQPLDSPPAALLKEAAQERQQMESEVHEIASNELAAAAEPDVPAQLAEPQPLTGPLATVSAQQASVPIVARQVVTYGAPAAYVKAAPTTTVIRPASTSPPPAAASPTRVTVPPELFAKLAAGGTLTPEEMAQVMGQRPMALQAMSPLALQRGPVPELPMQVPIAVPTLAPMGAPMLAPLAAPMVATMAAPIVAPLAAPTVAPLATMAAPMVAPLAAPPMVVPMPATAPAAAQPQPVGQGQALAAPRASSASKKKGALKASKKKEKGCC